MTSDIPQRVAERAATSFIENEAGCYISTYSTGSHRYAQIGWSENGKTQMTTAHRAAWVHHTGSQPGEQTVDHVEHCDRRCVRQDHLRLLSNAQNGRRNRRGLEYPLDWTCSRNHGVPRNRWGKCPECVNLHRRAYVERRKEWANEQR